MTAATLTLTDFLLARIAEDETAARAVVSDMARWDDPSWGRAALEVGGSLPGPQMTARMSPARVLAECRAKRRVVTALSEIAPVPHDSLAAMFGADAARYSLRALAAVYADHPDYRDEWRA